MFEISCQAIEEPVCLGVLPYTSTVHGINQTSVQDFMRGVDVGSVDCNATDLAFICAILLPDCNATSDRQSLCQTTCEAALNYCSQFSDLGLYVDCRRYPDGSSSDVFCNSGRP